MVPMRIDHPELADPLSTLFYMCYQHGWSPHDVLRWPAELWQQWRSYCQGRSQ